MVPKDFTTYHISCNSSVHSVMLNLIKQYEYVSLMKLQLPKSFYQINETNNTFDLVEDGVPVTKTIPEGNYSQTQFMTMIRTLLNSGSINTYAVTTPVNYSNGLMTITVTDGLAVPQLIIPSTKTGILFGLYEGTYDFVDDELTSEFVQNLNSENTVHVLIDQIAHTDHHVDKSN